MPTLIERLSEPSADRLEALIAESERLGLRFIRRLAEEWTSGANRFDRPGEALFVARIAGDVIGVCGLNVDPYAARPNVGRVRHLYVLSAHRRRGVGQRLVTEVIEAARGRFDSLRLRTENAVAARFYERLGFARSIGVAECTHVMAPLPAYIQGPRKEPTMADHAAGKVLSHRQLEELWAKHLEGEFETKDVEATLATMVEDAYVNHMPVNTGGRGKDALRRFYRDDFIPSWPDDVQTTPVNRVVGDGQLVDELHSTFTHEKPMNWFLPNVPPTHKRITMDLVVVVQFRGDKIACERIYWDHASVLRQVGLLKD